MGPTSKGKRGKGKEWEIEEEKGKERETRGDKGWREGREGGAREKCEVSGPQGS